ncbi:putative late blight resistance protein homolog R1A-3 [Henckelia pumila]|uniref:putative late blight resistance protein homolog R1A-3 n=1 Tax=Henckelia pumila TaxID=405737 RepID=UPI003C6DE8A1
MLWVAEGFLKPGDQYRCLEDVAEGYLEDLVNRNMILVREKGPDGKLITVGIHDLLREICTTKSEEEGFLHHASNAGREVVANPKRRLSYHFPQFFQELRLSVLDSPGVTWTNFSNEISRFINLRYSAFALNNMSFPNGFPASISKLPNLQTIIAHGIYHGILQLPYEILRMPKLRHLITSQTCYISNLSDVGMVSESDLKTLDSVINFTFTEETIKILAKLEKLILVIAKNWSDNWDDYNLNILFRLRNLEELQVFSRFDNDFYVRYTPNLSLSWSFAFPIGLKKLTLRGVRLLWKNMTIIGSLPNLQVFEMVENGMNGFPESWTTVEGQFLQLKYFCSSLDNLMKWEAEKDHFPSLERLILGNS